MPTTSSRWWRGMCAAALLVVPGAATTATEDGCRGMALTEVAEEIGLVFVHDRGATGKKYNPETMGSGLAWLDYDGDGWQDCYVVQSGPFPPNGSPGAANQLFRNSGNGRFEEVTERTGSGDRGYGQGVVSADFDGNGTIDIYLANWGPDRLLANLGDGRFEDRTERAGLGADGWSSAAAFGDTDRDGNLDLYLTRYVEHDPDNEPFCRQTQTGERMYCGPSVFVGKPDIFYRNQGDGSFEDATIEAGFANANGKGLGVIIVDLNDDEWPDIYVTNDMTFNLLFANRGDGTFEDLSLLSGTAVSREGLPEAGMGVGVGDVDGDLDPDLATANFDVQTNTLYINQGDFYFEDTAAASGFGVTAFNYVSFGLVMSDLNRDGFLDIFVGTGHTVEIPLRVNVTYEEPDVLVLGDGKGRFAEPDCPLPHLQPDVSRGVAFADYDNDGDADLGILRSGRPLSLLRNDTQAGSWLGLQLRSDSANSEGIGARVTLETTTGKQVRWVFAGDSYQSSSDRRLLFGFERGTEILDLEVLWPTGRRQRFGRLPVESYFTIYEQR